MGVKRRLIKSARRASSQGWDIAQSSPNVHEIVFKGISAGWEGWVFLSGDRHHDNKLTRWDMERKHLDLAVARHAPVIDIGDLFCAMQGKYDKRSDLTQVRPEHRVNNYLDALTSTAAEFYGPFARQFAVLGRGNHETSITDHCGIDLTSNLVFALNTQYGGQCFAGGYGGWVVLQFEVSTLRFSKRLKYFHGGGGGGPVTRGVIDTNRQAVYLPDADFVLNGHTHDAYIVPIQRERLSQSLEIKQDTTYYIRTPGYKNEYDDGSGGFHIERKGPPKPVGGAWLHFTYDATSHAIYSESILAVE